MTVNQLVGTIAERAGVLAGWKMDELRSQYPEMTETRNELVNLCKHAGYSRQDMVTAILLEEFSLELDIEMES